MSGVITYTVIYDNDKPQYKADKIYQICKDDELKEIIDWLQEYAESEE